MKTKNRILFLASVALLSATRPAEADVVITQEMKLGGGTSKITMSIKGAKVRTDNGTENSVIIDTTTGDMTTLMHEAKMAMTVKGADLKAATENLGKDKKSPVQEAGKLIATGKMEKIGEYECEIYTFNLAGTEAKMWIAKNYPGYDKFKAELSVMDKLAPGGMAPPSPPGMALKTETTVNGMKYVTTLISLKSGPVDEAIFKVPADYKAP